MKDNSIQHNLNMAIYITSGANFLAAAVLFVIYVLLRNYWYLIAAVLLFIAGIAFIFIIKSLQQRIEKKING